MQSISCISSKLTIICGMVSFTTGLTGWVDRSRFSAFLVICIDCDGFIGNLFVGVRICLTTVFVVVVFAGTLCVVLASVFLSLELRGLLSIVTWFFAVVANWFVFFWVLLCSLLRRSIYLQLNGSFSTIQFQLSFKM